MHHTLRASWMTTGSKPRPSATARAFEAPTLCHISLYVGLRDFRSNSTPALQKRLSLAWRMAPPNQATVPRALLKVRTRCTI